MEELIFFLNSIHPLTPRLEAHLRSIIKPIYFSKKDILLRKGEICNLIFYIEKGLLRSFYPSGNKDITNWFMAEGDICISLQSFHHRIPSIETIIALEDIIAHGITYQQLQYIYKKFPIFNYHGRIIATNYQCDMEKRLMATKTTAPFFKYADLMEKRPDLILRAKNQDIASYLGVGLRSFEAIKQKYQQQKHK